MRLCEGSRSDSFLRAAWDVEYLGDERRNAHSEKEVERTQRPAPRSLGFCTESPQQPMATDLAALKAGCLN